MEKELNVNEEVVNEEVELEVEDMENVEEESMDLLDLLDKDENIQKQFQSEVDKMITRAIQTRDKKHKEELKKQEQRANMTASELQAEKERELDEREQRLHEYEIKLAKIDYFKENNVPLELVDFVRVSNEEEIEENTQTLMNVINAQIEQGVKKQLTASGLDIEDDNTVQEFSLEELSNQSKDDINKAFEQLL